MESEAQPENKEKVESQSSKAWRNCGGGGLVAQWCQTLATPWTVAC